MAATLEGGDGRRRQQKGQQTGFRGEGRELYYDIAIELRIYITLPLRIQIPTQHHPHRSPAPDSHISTN